jgi:hypothetical protein
MKCWNNGIMGDMTKNKLLILRLNPTFHHSSISLFHHPAGEDFYGS